MFPDCSAPFAVGVRTDTANEANSAIAGDGGAGVCLDFWQEAC